MKSVVPYAFAWAGVIALCSCTRVPRTRPFDPWEALGYRCPSGTTLRVKGDERVCIDPQGLVRGPQLARHDSSVRPTWTAQVIDYGKDGRPIIASTTTWNVFGRKVAESDQSQHSSTTYWPNDQAAESGAIDAQGRRTGAWQYFTANGDLWAKGEFSNGNALGVWVFSHASGTVWRQGAFTDGKEDGTWHTWNPGGEMIRVEVWSRGEIKSRRRPTGHEKSQQPEALRFSYHGRRSPCARPAATIRSALTYALNAQTTTLEPCRRATASRRGSLAMAVVIDLEWTTIPDGSSQGIWTTVVSGDDISQRECLERIIESLQLEPAESPCIAHARVGTSAGRYILQSVQLE